MTTKDRIFNKKPYIPDFPRVLPEEVLGMFAQIEGKYVRARCLVRSGKTYTYEWQRGIVQGLEYHPKYPEAGLIITLSGKGHRHVDINNIEFAEKPSR